MKQHPLNSHALDAGLLLIRTVAGAVFTFHGAQKLLGLFSGPGIHGFAGYLAKLNVPFPELSAYVAAGTELFGGIALLTGVAVRLAGLPLCFTMLVASFAAHGTAFDSLKGGMEYPLTLAVISLALTLTGAGRFTLILLLKSAPRSIPASVSPSHVSA